MASSNSGNQSINSGNYSTISSISTPTNAPSSSRLTNDSPRRSARLSSKSPQIAPRSITQLNIHRTVTGGVAGSSSPKINIRRRSSLSHVRGNLSNNLSQIMINDNINNDNGHDNTNTTGYNLPSDQSDDEEMDVNNHTNNTTVPPASSRLATRAEVLSHFEKHINGYKCKHCHKVYRASRFSDSNLRKHLSSSIHNASNMLFKSQTNNISKSNETTISTERRKELFDAAVNCVVEDGVPFNIFRRSGMSKFLATAVPGFIGPNRKTVRKRIAALYSSHMAKLRLILPQLDFIALTTDMWKSSRQIHYISLTAHVFNHKFETIPIILSCRRVIGQHLSTCIERYIKYELNRLGIQLDQVISITTDNGSNIKKATSSFQFGQPIRCIAHNLNLVVKKGLCLWKEPKPDDFPLQLDFNLDEWEDLGDDMDDIDDTSECSDNPMDAVDELISEEEDNSSNEDDEKLVRESAFSESEDEDVGIQLSSLKLNDNNSSHINHYELLNNIFQLMKKTRIVIKFMKNHSVTNEYINKYMISTYGVNKFGGLVLDMIIRWCSSFLMLKRLIKHKDILNNIFAFPVNLPGLNEKQKECLKELALNQHEWEVLQALKFVLQPFLNSITVLSGQTYPTMAASFYIFRSVSHFLQTTTDDVPLIVALKESLRFWFNIQCKSKLPVGQMEIMMIAAFLDPIFYKKMNDNDRKAAKKLIFRKLNNKNVDRFTLSLSSSTATTTATTTTIKLNPLDKLAAVCGLTVTSSTSSKKAMTLDEELCSYIKAATSSDNFQEFWATHHEQLPRLSKLVRRTNIIPATSISSEALFSVAGFLARKQRSSLSPKTLRYLLTLKNRDVLEKFEQDF